MASGTGRVPKSVQHKRPAQVISAPPPGVVTGPLPPTPTVPGRSPFRASWPRRDRPPRPLRGRRSGPAGLIVLALLFIALFCVSMGIGAATGFDVGSLFRGPDEPPARSVPALGPSRPERLEIPALDLSAPILEVGRADDGSVGVPPVKRHNEAGWFGGGPTPGQLGPALILGHAGTRTEPSVFHDLDRLKPGQKIEVTRADGSVAVFEVDSVEPFDKAHLPVQRIYGDYRRPSLRLMTCGGAWLGCREGSADTIIVFATLAGFRKA